MIPVGATCCKTMYSGAGYRNRTCRKPAKVERDGGLYCGLHDPVKLEERRKASNAAQQAKWDLREANIEKAKAALKEIERRAQAYPKLVAALAAIRLRTVQGDGGCTVSEDVLKIASDAIAEVGEE